MKENTKTQARSKRPGRGGRLGHIARRQTAKRGEIGAEIVWKMMIMLMMIYCFIQLAPLAMVFQNLSTVATNLTRTVELSGRFGDEYEAQIVKYQDRLGYEFTPEYEVEEDGWYDQDAKKLAFRAEFLLTVSLTYRVNFITPTLGNEGAGINVPVSKSLYGTSEIYWKD